MKIHITKNGQQLGPFDEAQLTELLQTGQISYDDLAWTEGMSSWQPLRTICEPPDGTPPAPPQDNAAQATVTPTTEPVALWNPTACVNWSLLFTPIFGSLLVWRNYQILKDNSKMRKALYWAVACIALAVISMFLPENKAKPALYALMIPWYILVARPQMKYVKERFGGTYPKKSWKQPLGIAIAGLVVYGVIAAVFAPAQVEDTAGNGSSTVELKTAQEDSNQAPKEAAPKKQSGPTDAQLAKMVVGKETAYNTGGGMFDVKATSISKITRGERLVSNELPGVPAGTEVYPIRVTVHLEPVGDPKTLGNMLQDFKSEQVMSNYFYKDSFGDWKAVPMDE